MSRSQHVIIEQVHVHDTHTCICTHHTSTMYSCIYTHLVTSMPFPPPPSLQPSLPPALLFPCPPHTHTYAHTWSHVFPLQCSYGTYGKARCYLLGQGNGHTLGHTCLGNFVQFIGSYNTAYHIRVVYHAIHKGYVTFGTCMLPDTILGWTVPARISGN